MYYVCVLGVFFFGMSCAKCILPFSIMYLVCSVDTGMTSVYDVDEEPKNIVLRAFLMVVWDCILEPGCSPTFFLLPEESKGEGLCSLCGRASRHFW